MYKVKEVYKIAKDSFLVRVLLQDQLGCIETSNDTKVQSM